MKKPLDNRMGWIRNIEKLQNIQSGAYITEYEISSESYIPGVLDYMDGAIMCSLMTFQKDSNGFYKYLLKIKYPCNDNDFSFLNANKRGYLFKEGIPGELISIFSFFYQCRFFLLAAYTGNLSPESLKIKKEYSPLIKACKPYFNPDSSPGNQRNFSVGLSEFLDKLSRLDSTHHQELILGFYNYARALREFGIDEEMVFIRLVSSVEAFSERVQLSKNDDLFNGLQFEDIIRTDRLSAYESDELEKIFSVRKTRKKFRIFFESNSKGFFTGGNFKEKHLRIKKDDLPKALNAIYDNRSDYLHRGEPMYLSQHVKGSQKWDIDPMAGMIIDNRSFSSEKKLPYSFFFQSLVRHCIMNYIMGLCDDTNY